MRGKRGGSRNRPEDQNGIDTDAPPLGYSALNCVATALKIRMGLTPTSNAVGLNDRNSRNRPEDQNGIDTRQCGCRA